MVITEPRTTFIEPRADSIISEGSYEVRTVHKRSDLLRAYRLRHQVFAETLRWVPLSEDGLEFDAYDAVAFHFGLFDREDSLLAYVRLITAEHRFMIEREFLSVIGDERLVRKTPDTCELTRFCVSPEARKIFIAEGARAVGASSFLLMGIYHWCIDHDIRYCYGITDRTIHKYLTIKGFPFFMIGVPRVMPDGVVARAVLLDWREFERLNESRKPELLLHPGYKSSISAPSAMATA